MSKTFTSETGSQGTTPVVPTAPLVSATSRPAVLDQWNQTDAPFPSSLCLHQLFESQVEKTPYACAVAQDTRRLSYRELNSKANQLAQYLRAFGVQPNDPVAICLHSGVDFAIAILAVLKAGGACVPFDPAYPNERLAFMLEDVGARLLLGAPELLSKVGPISTPMIDLDSAWPFVHQQTDRNLAEIVSPEDLAYVIYTSGSTGTPKGVLLGHRGLVNHSTASIELYGLTSKDRMLQFASISFDITIEELFPTWSSGGAVVFKDSGFSLGFAEFMEFIRKYEITALDLPTAYWHEWTNFLFDNQELPPANLRLVIVGGEKVSAAILARWQSRVGNRVRWINTYGPSEASVIATSYEPSAGNDVTQAVPIGRPISNTRIYLLDEALEPVPVGEAGELFIGGVGIALGYLNRPELTRQKFVPDPFSTNSDARLYRTGDMARYRGDGQIEFLGREDDQVKIRGFRVEPGEIEEVLSRHETVREAAVVAREDEPGQKRLVAYIVTAKNHTFRETELREYLKSKLPDYMVPGLIVRLNSMPMTPNGKVDRRNLPEPAAQVEISTATGSDSLQSKVARIWQDVLGRPVGLQDNFFEVGGHSLLAAKLMHRIGQLAGKTLPLALLLEAPTIEQLSVAVSKNGWSKHWCSLVPIQPQGSQAPFFCIHGVGGNVLGFHDLGRHLAPTHPFYGLQARGLDGKHDNPVSIEEMAAHYLGEIRTVQPKGPYLLGGFSFGGLVAYEMARQLQAQDEQVALLALFDTYPGKLEKATSSLLRGLRSPSPQLVTQLARSVRRRTRLLWRRVTWPRHLREVFQTNSRALNRYALQPYSGNATLFRASEQSLRSGDDPYAAWFQLVKGGVEIQEIPGSHNGILVEPEVGFLAERLKYSIDAALTKHQSLVAR